MTGAAVSVCLLFLVSLCSACYISNCPIGGKRSIMDAPLRKDFFIGTITSATRKSHPRHKLSPKQKRTESFKCMSCGPGDRGRCFGPSICCGEGLGCLLGSPETAHCVEENYLLTPCHAGGRPCGSEGGRCASSGLCCDAESCTTDQSCLIEEDGEDQTGQLEGGDPGDIILRLLHLVGHASPHQSHQ